MRPWLLPPVYERLRRGQGNFLAELRSTVALFLRFGGIDYDGDEQAGAKLDGYMRWIQSIVARYDRTLIDLNIDDKGSYLYINFGAPLAHEKDAERAATALLALARDRQFAIYGGECESYGVNSSYLVWHSIWLGLFGIDPRWAADRQIEHLMARVSAIDPALLPRLPLLSIALQLEIPDNELTASLDAKLRKHAREGMLADCLAAAAQEQPLLIVLEDCQWLDPLSHDLLEALSANAASLSILFLYLNRPFEPERLRTARVSALPHHTSIDVAPFSDDEAAPFVFAKIVHLAGDDFDVPSLLVERIVARAEGNPLFLDELINYLHHQGVDFRDPTGWIALRCRTVCSGWC